MVTSQSPLWRTLRDEALQACDRDSAVAPLFENAVLRWQSTEEALIAGLSNRLGDSVWTADAIAAEFTALLESAPGILVHLERDLRAVLVRDPACNRLIEPLLFFKGFQALQAHRFSHAFWMGGRRDLALFIQSRMSERFQVDIHPGTRIGGGLFLDHATGIVIGETAVIDDDVSVMQNVTLGGTGKAAGDRHPKVRRGVLVGAGAKVLGNIALGCCARVAASSVVLEDVPEGATVAGIPARIVSVTPPQASSQSPAVCMDHALANQRLVDHGLGI
ncbi:MAG: serine O-acetyltransferase [Devosiaceae bacterium]|nr:serine O-acetyltransferase [Devosiaceae bacterium MH13]